MLSSECTGKHSRDTYKGAHVRHLLVSHQSTFISCHRRLSPTPTRLICPIFKSHFNMPSPSSMPSRGSSNNQTNEERKRKAVFKIGDDTTSEEESAQEESDSASDGGSVNKSSSQPQGCAGSRSGSQSSERGRSAEQQSGMSKKSSSGVVSDASPLGSQEREMPTSQKEKDARRRWLKEESATSGSKAS